MATYLFRDEKIIKDNFNYAYSPHSQNVREFRQCDGFVSNFDECNPEEYSYTSIITKEKYKSGATVFAGCSFGKFGAPLIVITDDISDGNNGMKLFGLHFEVVAYEKGINVWHIVPAPERTERPIKPTLIGSVNFDVSPDEMIEISVKINEGELIINVNGNSLEVKNSDIPECFYAGITACEGPDKFYEFKIEE